MNIVVWLLEVDSIELVEIQGKLGVKCLVLANLQYGKNFHLKNSTVGAIGYEVVTCRIISMPYPTKCDRCRQSMSDCCMSKFNSDYICGTCQTKEQSHPQYAIATEVAKRMSNFSGIGKPSDL